MYFRCDSFHDSGVKQLEKTTVVHNSNFETPTEVTPNSSCAIFDRKEKQYYQVKTNKSYAHAFVKVYNLDKKYKYLKPGNIIPNPAFSFNNPKKSCSFADTLFHTPDEVQINLNLKHYSGITRTGRAREESNVAEILKENRQKLDLLFKEKVPVEELFPPVRKSQNTKRLRIKIIPKGPVVADHDLIPTKRTDDQSWEGSKRKQLEESRSSDSKVQQPKINRGLVNVEPTKAEEPKSVQRVTFTDQIEDCDDTDVNVTKTSSFATDTDKGNIMSTAMETFVPPPNAVSRIQEKHELQDVNDRLSQYIQVDYDIIFIACLKKTKLTFDTVRGSISIK